MNILDQQRFEHQRATDWAKHNHESSTDWARLNLEYARTHADIEIDFMKAQADYAFRMTQVAELQQKISQSIDRQMMLREAYRQYKRMLGNVRAEVRRLEKRKARIDKMVFRSNLLYLGETLPKRSVGHAWTGWRWLFLNLQGSKTEAAYVKLTSEDQRPENFFCPKHPERQLDGHMNLSTILQLALHCRKLGFVPVIASSFMVKLKVMIELMDVSFRSQAEAMKMELDDMREANRELSAKHFADVAALQN